MSYRYCLCKSGGGERGITVVVLSICIATAAVIYKICRSDVLVNSHLPPVPLFPFLEEDIKPVKIINASQYVDFAVIAIQEKVPLLIQHSQVSLWPALKKWTPDYVGTELPKVKVHLSSSPDIQMMSLVQPFGKLPGINWKRPWIEKEVTSMEFFSGQHFYYFMSNIDDLPVQLLKDITDISFLSVSWRPIWEVNLWMGLSPMRTPMHYDVLHNFYVQIFGQKRFVLFPPSDSVYMHLYPRLHPSTRMSQINLSKLEPFPDFLMAHPQTITLSPGDVLYIPPYWFHDVTVIGSNSSISISIHTESDQSDVRNSMNSMLPPIRKMWSNRQKIDALAAFLEELFEEEGEARSFVQRMLTSRYDLLNYDDTVEGLTELLRKSREEYSEMPNSKRLHGTLKADLLTFAQSFREVVRQFGEGEYDIELANYIEDICNYIIGNPLMVDPFLRSFASGKSD